MTPRLRTPVKPLHGVRAALAYASFFRDPVRTIMGSFRRFGPIAVLGDVIPRADERLRVLALGPEFNRQVLGQPGVFHTLRLTVPGPRGSAHVRLSRGLTALNGDHHEAERRLAAPFFNTAAVAALHQRFLRVFAARLEGWTPGRRIDFWQEALKLMMGAAVVSLFGEKRQKAGNALGSRLHDWLHSTWSFRVLLFPFNLPGSPYRRMLRAAEEIERGILSELEQHGEEIREGGGLLAEWANARAGMPGDSLGPTAGQVSTLFLASFETSVNALAWTVFLLAQHPEVQAAVSEELDGLLQGTPPTEEQLGKLPLLEAVVKESMRLVPPVPYTLRRVKEPVEVGGVNLRRGDVVILSHYFTHHMPELYPDPQQFRPERWEQINPNQYEYLPFSAGPRRCIGYHFAMTVLKTSLALIFQRCRLSVVPNAKIDCAVEVSMRPRHGLPMVIHRRDHALVTAPVRGDILEMVELPPPG